MVVAKRPVHSRRDAATNHLVYRRSHVNHPQDWLDAAELEAWTGVFDRLEISPELRLRIARHCVANGTPLQAEFLASGLIDECSLYERLADELGVPFSKAVGPSDILNGEADCVAWLGGRRGALSVRLLARDFTTAIAVSSDRLQLAGAKALLARNPEVRQRLCVVPPQVLRSALLAKCRPELMWSAVHKLFARRPDLSARIIMTSTQGYLLGLATLAVPLLFILFPEVSWLALHLLTSLFFLACVGLRAAAIAFATPNRRRPLVRVSVAELPTYSVLVALYKEAEIVPELLVALGSILWPRSKLEIKLVCEADDHETLAALRAQRLKPWVEIIEVPPGVPRTKPKALAYALPVTTGEFVVLYDAEDRPHPAQLLEAWQTFETGPPDVVCLQAPLEISNQDGNLITRMFRLEYSGLFNGLLPFLSRSRLLIPLGGTSNHFRRSALEEVGGWDPFNVTEDADLGIRLLRYGYRTQTISRPTYETAPDRWRTWVPQRTRWFKGWCQTWLVHMRSPGRLWAEIGPGSFWVTQILFAGLVLSAIAHPLMIATFLWLSYDLWRGVPLGVMHSVILVVDAVNIASGYASFLLLAWRTLDKRDHEGFWTAALFTPAYWLMMSLAAWRALWQLWSSPHRWEKTPHFRSRP